MSERPPLLWDLVRMSIKLIVGTFVLLGLISCVGAVAGSGGRDQKEAESQFIYGDEESDNQILEVKVVGPILTHKPEGDGGGLFGTLIPVTYGYEVKEQLLKAAKNDEVKAVMMFVTTPGGSIVGSEAIHDGVLAVKAAGKPIIAYVDTISASGGVWSTAAADQIFADFGSLIGSVGVNFGNFQYYDDPVALDGGFFSGGVETRGGIKTNFIGAGLGKDIGNPFRPMTEREMALLNATAEEFYQDFLNHVVENRGMDRQALIEQHGAMIYGNALAQKHGYIDGSKTYQETLAYIAEQIGASGDDWKLVTPPVVKKSAFEEMFGAFFNRSATMSTEEAVRLRQAAMCKELKAGPVAMPVGEFVSLCGA